MEKKRERVCANGEVTIKRERVHLLRKKERKKVLMKERERERENQ